MIGRSGDSLTGEISEAEMIARLKEDHVSAQSVSLPGKELGFLARRQHSQ